MSEAGILKYIKEVMKDTDGAYSNKRFITTAAFVFLTIAFFSNLFWNFTIHEFIFNSMAAIVMAGLASHVGERFAVAWVERNKANSQTYGPDMGHVPARPEPEGQG